VDCWYLAPQPLQQSLKDFWVGINTSPSVMKYAILTFIILFLCLVSTKSVLAQAVTPAPPVNETTEVSTAGNSVLNTFISGFDWISTGLIFNTPAILDQTIKLNDGTTLTGLSEYRNIFYDIAIPLFVVIISFIAFSHITHDNHAQLKNFFKRLAGVSVLFLITPAIFTYSIQFVNLLNNKILAQNSENLISFITNYINSGDFTTFLQSISDPAAPINLLFSPQSTLQLIIFLIAIGFFLIGFLYIIFQSVIRFIALLILSVIFPIVIPFALSEKTENIANTYYRMWFTFLIQQPAFVLGFAIVSAILGSIIQAHGGSVGTLFVFSGSLIFLGAINVFIARIFGEGWTLVSANAQSMMGSQAITGTFREVKRGAMPMGIRRSAGRFLAQSFATLPAKTVDTQKYKTPDTSNAKKDAIIHPHLKTKLIKKYSKKKNENSTSV